MSIKYTFIKTIPFLFLLHAFCACQKEEPGDETPATATVSRTIIVYMAADNDLSEDALENLKQMEQGFSNTGARLVVFIDRADEKPSLLEIHPDKATVVKSYPELNSASSAVLKDVILDAIGLYPAQEYGLILWSHGSSWMPADSWLRSFGNDSGKRMNIPDLAASLPIKFGFIIFDVCLMGAVEVAYELMEKTDYIIASSTETIYEGFPYDRIVPELIKPNVDFNAVVQSYFDYYNAKQGAYRSATVSVVQTRYLTDLAYSLKLLLENNSVDLSSFDRTTVQRLDVYDEQYVFDLSDFIGKLLPDADKSDFIAQLNKVVLYKNHTPQFILEYEINTFCGLSCYIPHPDRNDLNTYYKTLRWYRDAGLSYLFQ